MTEASPAGGADFRRRVLARIASGDAPRARWRPLFVVAPLASIAAIVLALVMVRPATVRLKPDTTGATAPTVRKPDTTGATGPTVRKPDATGATGPTVRKPDTTGATGPTVQLPPSPPDRFGETREPDTTGAARATVRRPRSPPDGFGGARALDTLAIDPLDVTPMGIHALAPDPILVERLETIVPLVIAPLDSIEEQGRFQ
jgi:hypothetical protein